MSTEDKKWLCRNAGSALGLRFMNDEQTTIIPGVTALKLGGHFPGSLVLHYDDKLFIADTIVTVPVRILWPTNDDPMLTLSSLLCTTKIAFPERQATPSCGW